MRRLFAISLSGLLFAAILLGCNRPHRAKDDDNKQIAVDPNIKVEPKKEDDVKKKTAPPKNDVDPAAAEKHQKFNDAVQRGLLATLDNNRIEALAAFELALSIKDDELVRAEIAKLKDRNEQDGTAKATIKSIETVIDEGKADDAVRLVNAALKEFGDGDDADRLVQLKLQADALQAVQSDEKNDARFERFRDEGKAAQDKGQKRAAALAYEQALQARDDAGLRKAYEELRADLDKYDALRKKAAELRRDAGQLDEALAALKQAKDAWDTPQLRNETDEVLLALAKRRDAVSVADFEMGNDVGAPDAGAALADEILPLLKTKYDLVERAQLKRVIKELGLENGVGDGAQEQLSRLTKVRYLVVGNIRQVGGVIVQARLVDVRTGLVVQTAKIVAPTIEDALNQAPDLAKQLLMSDDEKMQYDLEVQQKAADKVEVVAADEAVKPAPLPPDPEAPRAAPKMRILNPAPPQFGNLKPDAFANLQAPPAQALAPPADVPPPQVGQRVLFASLEMGDMLFRAGRYREAQRHFEFALNLAPGNFDIRMRLENVRPLLPPAVAPPPGFVARPRLAVLPFVTVGNPRVAPESLSYWTPTNLAPYFSSRYDVVDPTEVYWFMGKMGLTVQDLMTNPAARRWLGRAVGVQYFVLGSQVENRGLDVNAYLIDAEFGYLAGAGSINVQNRYELRMRLWELAAITMMSPAERAAYFEVQRQKRFEQLVVSGRRNIDERKYALAVADLTEALRLRPGVIIVQIDLAIAQDALRLELFQAESRRRYEAQLAERARQRAQQLQLAQQAAAARQRAIAEAAVRTEPQRKVWVNYRFQARSNMLAQARFALKTKDFSVSVSLFKGALDMGPPQADAFQDFAQARLAAENAARERDERLARDRQNAWQQQRQLELSAAQKALAAEQQRQRDIQDAARAAVLKRDKSVFDATVAQGNTLMAQGKNEPAIVAFQGALRVAHGPEQVAQVNLKLDILMQRQAEAMAKAESAAKLKEVESKLAAERARRKLAEAQAKQNEQRYTLAMQLAQKSLNEKNYDDAQAKFEEAGKLYRSDAYLAGLRQVEQGRALQRAEKDKPAAEAKKAERVKQLIAEGNAKLDGKNYSDAVHVFQEAKKLAPTDLGVMTGLTRAEQLRNQFEGEAQRKVEETARAQNFQRLLKSGQENLANKQYEAAAAILGEAVKLNPTDATALAALKKAKDAASAYAKDKAALQQRIEAYQKHLDAGQLALSSKRYDDAIKAFTEAQKVLPGDKASKDYLQDAQNAKKAAEDALAATAKQRAEEAKKADAVKKALTQGRIALAANDLTTAVKLFNQAKALEPNNAELQRALKDLDQAMQRKDAEAAALKKREADFKAFLDTGKTALAKKQYPEALKALSNATTLLPDNKEAQDLFRRAQNEKRQAEEAAAKADLQKHITAGLAAIKAKNYDLAAKELGIASVVDPTNPAIVQGLKDIEAGRQAAFQEKQKQANYQLNFSAGEKALKAKNYDEAIKSFRQALEFMPGDIAATKQLLQAQQARDNVAAEAKTQASFKLAMDAGEKALKARMYAEAIVSFKDALKLIPNDLRAKTLRAQAEQALDSANLEAKTQANFKLAMDAGEKALKAMNYGAAVKSFNDAFKLVPTDARAKQLLSQAQQALQLEQAQQNYSKAMSAGQLFLKNMKYAEAIKSFNDALKWMPKDVQALQGLQTAQKALDLSKMKTPPPNPFDQAMQRGAALEKEQKYLEAMKAFQDALKVRQKDPDALAGVKRNQFANHVVVGQKYLEGGMFIEAQREFEAALRIQNDKDVQQLLDKAKKKMKK